LRVGGSGPGPALKRIRAGTRAWGRVRVETRGTATWRPGRVKLSYHWLDPHGNPIVWDGARSELPQPLGPGQAETVDAAIRAPIPPGPYVLAFDLVEEGRFWFAELGDAPLEVRVDVLPRDAAGAGAPLDGAGPADDWQELARAAHERGYAAAGGSIDRGRRGPRELEPYAPGGGRDPAFGAPLVCPSLLPPLRPNAEVA